MIGPELPPHLLQSNTSTADDEEEEQHTSIGPQIPPEVLNQSTSTEAGVEEEATEIGPQIPPESLPERSTVSQDEEETRDSEEKPKEDEDEDEDDYMPALPPELAAKRVTTSSTSKPPPQRKSPSPPRHRPIGPSLPSYGPTYSASTSLPHFHTETGDDDDDEDEEVGPKPLPSGMQHVEKDPVQEFIEREERRRQKELEESQGGGKKLQREEWMLVPPSASDLLGKLDTTKLKPRQFARTSGPVNRGSEDHSLWTETPQEKMQRIADEVAGRKRRAVDVANDAATQGAMEERKKRKKDEEIIRKGVEEYTAKLRGPSLVEQHQTKTKSSSAEEDENKMIWDHARDMAIGGRLMDEDKRKQMIKEARGLGDRFGSGKGGSFL